MILFIINSPNCIRGSQWVRWDINNKSKKVIMPKKNQIVFARPIDASKSSHGCSSISSIQQLDRLSMQEETRSQIDVESNPNQQYRQLGFLMNGDTKVAVVVQKQEGTIVKNYGSYQLLFNGVPNKKQARAAHDFLRKHFS